MKILIIGSDGFVGRNIADLLSKDHEVYRGSRRGTSSSNSVLIDLLDKETIKRAINQIQPEVIVNAAGVVENSEAARANVTFTTNLLETIKECDHKPRRVIISGSAAEYGLVDESNIPVAEGAPLNAGAGYGLSKKDEVAFALKFSDKNGLEVIIARIFNPIGVGMHEKFLLPKLIVQTKEVQAGLKKDIEVNRLDAKRDYLNIKDVASAIKLLVEGSPKENIYNIGSGEATTTQELIETIVSELQLSSPPNLIESSDTPEPIVAIQADISRLKDEFGWSPGYSLKETVKEIIDATR